MRIAYLVNQYPKVSHSFIRREIQALEALGCEVSRIAARGWKAELADPADIGEQRHTQYLLAAGWRGLMSAVFSALRSEPRLFVTALMKATQMGWRADRPLPVHWVYLAEACLALQWVQQAQAQHVHAHFGTNAAEVAMLVHLLGGPPYSFTVHGPEEFDRPRELKLAEKTVNAKLVVAISSFGRSQLYRWLPHKQWSKVVEVHCGLDDTFKETSIEPVRDSNRLVCVGRLCEQKGQLLLIEAARQLSETREDFELVLAGDGEMRAEIESFITEYKLEKVVRITGWISTEQVKQELLAARALVLPSFGEGLPVVIMEAMALERPVISTYIAGIPELVEPGACGWLVPAGNVDALVVAMRQCLASSPEALCAMGEAARTRVLARHDIHIEGAKLLTLFQS